MTLKREPEAFLTGRRADPALETVQDLFDAIDGAIVEYSMGNSKPPAKVTVGQPKTS